MTDKLDQRINRPFIERLRRDPRMHAMVTGWVAQAAITAEGRYPFYGADLRHVAQDAAKEALHLALSFILDNDGEYRAVCEERDRLLENSIKLLETTPHPVFMGMDIGREVTGNDK